LIRLAHDELNRDGAVDLLEEGQRNMGIFEYHAPARNGPGSDSIPLVLFQHRDEQLTHIILVCLRIWYPKSNGQSSFFLLFSDTRI
jgi:hypothetical protein